LTEFDELQQLASETRSFIETSHNRVWALQAVVYAHDVVLGIYPDSEGLGLHVIKGDAIFREIIHHGTDVDFSHTAIALATREQAVALQKLLN
jgi:hypothetical protein